MKSSYKFMQGASKQQEKALIYKAFLLVILFFVPNFVPKSLYSQNKRVSSKTRYLSNTRFHQKNHREGGSFLSIVKHSSCKLVHEIDVLQDFYLIHMVHIFKAS